MRTDSRPLREPLHVSQPVAAQTSITGMDVFTAVAFALLLVGGVVGWLS